MEVWYYIITISSLLAFKVGWDLYSRFIRKRTINHNQSVVIDGILYTASAVWFLMIRGDYQWWDIIGFVMLAGAARWVIFDPVFSLLSGTGFHHHGKSANLDKWLLQVGKGHFFVKLIPVALGLLLILL